MSDPYAALRNKVNAQAVEIERLQKILDSRPAINAGLPQTHIDWSQSIYQMEFSRVVETTQ